jgi:hypothetical protein
VQQLMGLRMNLTSLRAKEGGQAELAKRNPA